MILYFKVKFLKKKIRTAVEQKNFFYLLENFQKQNLKRCFWFSQLQKRATSDNQTTCLNSKLQFE